MKTLTMFAKARMLLSSWKTPVSAPLIESHDTLEQRIFEHLSAYADLQLLLGLGTTLAQLPEACELKAEAQNLVATLSTVPHFREIDPLNDAHHALICHWKNSWSNGGVSATAYRTALKALILYVRNNNTLSAARGK